MPDDGDSDDILGRERELAALVEETRRAIRSGRPSVVIVNGDAGIGKSTLLSAFVEKARAEFSAEGLLAGYGEALVNTTASDSYQVVRDCLSSISTTAERRNRAVAARVARAFVDHAPDWAELIPVVGTLVSAGLRTTQTALAAQPVRADTGLSAQLVDLVRELVGRAPVLLVLDDLHWADQDTVNALTAIERQVDGPLTLVLAYRPDGLAVQNGSHPLQPLLTRLHRYRTAPVREIALEPLPEEATRELVERLGAEELSAESVAEIVRHSGGNPLFAEELTHRTEKGAVPPPTRITSVITERLGKLPVPDRQLLEKASVVGYRFEVEHLARLVGLGTHELYDRLDALFAERFVEEAPFNGVRERYALAHPLLAEVLRERTSANGPRWRHLHRSFLSVLEDGREGWDLETLTRVVDLAATAGESSASSYAVEASKRQFDLGAVHKATELARIAVEHSEHATPSEAGEAFLQLAQCLTTEGDHRAAALSCETAIPALPPEAVPDAEFLQARNLRMSQQWDDALTVLARVDRSETANDVLRAQASLLRAEVLLCGPHQDTSEAVALCEKAREMTDDPIVRLRATGHIGLAHLAAGNEREAEAALAEAWERVGEHTHPYSRYEVRHWVAKKAIAFHEWERAAAVLEELDDISERFGVYRSNPRHLRDRSRLLGLGGDEEKAGALAASFLQIAVQALSGRSLASLLCQVAELDVVRGRGSGDRFLAGFAGNTSVEDTAVIDLLAVLQERRGGWDPVGLAVEHAGVARDEAEAAEATFRFYIPDFTDFRIARWEDSSVAAGGVD